MINIHTTIRNMADNTVAMELDESIQLHELLDLYALYTSGAIKIAHCYGGDLLSLDSSDIDNLTVTVDDDLVSDRMHELAEILAWDIRTQLQEAQVA